MRTFNTDQTTLWTRRITEPTIHPRGDCNGAFSLMFIFKIKYGCGELFCLFFDYFFWTWTWIENCAFGAKESLDQSELAIPPLSPLTYALAVIRLMSPSMSPLAISIKQPSLAVIRKTGSPVLTSNLRLNLRTASYHLCRSHHNQTRTADHSSISM